MMSNKSNRHVPAVSMAIFLILACVWQSMANVTAESNRASQELSTSLGMNGAKNRDLLTQKSLDQDLDTLFAGIKADFDKMAASPVLKSQKIKMTNVFFWHSLKKKTHQPWQSLIRTDKKGMAINEVVRIEGVSKKKRSVADQAWFVQVSKTMNEYVDIIKMENTGRYCLVWAAPIVSKVKGKETFQGAMAAQIDLWDCFEGFSDQTTTPFTIRILKRVLLYDHMWNDTIKYVEKPLTVPGIDKISVRYPDIANEAATLRATETAALEQARLDSIRAKTAADLAAREVEAEKAKSRKTILTLLAIGLLILVVVVVVLLVYLGKNHRIMRSANNEKTKSRFDKLV